MEDKGVEHLPKAHIGVNLYRMDFDLYVLKQRFRCALNNPKLRESLQIEIDVLEKQLGLHK